MSISNNFITQLFNSKIIKILPNILLKFIIRKKKIYFIKSDLNILPSTNYPFEFREQQLDQYFDTIENKKNNLPFNEFPHLALLLKSIFQNKSSFSLLDFGAQFIDNFLFLKKNNPNMIYYYHDQKDNNLAIQKFVEKKKLKDIYVLQNVIENKSINYDFVYFGSVIQYVENYKKANHLSKKLSKYNIGLEIIKTKTYKKKYELYGLYEIREINKRPESIFLVEGYMDVIGLFQHGIKNAVASSGTAFTQEQLRKILSYTNTIYIVFDGDEAGYKASWRAVENALPLLREDTRISFIFLEPDEDPDSYVSSNGKDAFLDLAKKAKSFSDFFSTSPLLTKNRPT